MDEKSGKQDRLTDQLGRSMRAMSDYFGIGLQIAVSFAFFVFLGYWADSKLGTSPGFMLVGVVVGMVGMMLVLLKIVRKANRDHDHHD